MMHTITIVMSKEIMYPYIDYYNNCNLPIFLSAWPLVWVSRLVGFFAAPCSVVSCFPCGSLLYISCVLLGTLVFFCSIQCFLLIIYIYIYIYMEIKS